MELNPILKRISSKTTFFHKKIFPTFWFGILVAFIITIILAFGVNSQMWFFLAVPVFMTITGFFIMKKMVFDLTDEVYDEGDFLLFRNSGKEVKVNLCDIVNVRYSTILSPPKVTINIRYETEFGKELSFLPPVVFIPFKKNRDIEALIDRIEKARS